MDDVEKGFDALMRKIEALPENEAALAGKIKENEARLLQKMGTSAIPVVKIVGLNMLKKGKQDTKGEIYDPQYYPLKMIILGKSEQPSAFRPDNPSMPVVDQFCVLSEEGDFFELMYSFDGFLTDSYLNPVTAKEALEIYGYDIMFMLYRAMHDYLKNEEALLASLEIVIGYVFGKKKQE